MFINPNISSSSSSSSSSGAAASPASPITRESLEKVTRQAKEQQDADSKKTSVADANIKMQLLKKIIQTLKQDPIVQQASGQGFSFSIGQGGDMREGNQMINGRRPLCQPQVPYQEDGFSLDMLSGAMVQDINGTVEFAKKLQATYQSMARATSRHGEGGACAATAVMIHDVNGNVYIITANLGDCRILLRQKDGTVIRLTKTHHPDVPEEKERLTALHLHLSFSNRIGCSVSTLAMSRSFGDALFKRDFGSSDDGEFGLYCIPAADVKGAELLLMSDGVSDVLDENTIAWLMKTDNYKTALNKADFLRSVAYTIRRDNKIKPDNATMAIFKLGEIQEGFIAHVYDGHGDDGELRKTLTDIFNREFKEHVKQLVTAGVLKSGAGFNPFDGVLPNPDIDGESLVSFFQQACQKAHEENKAEEKHSSPTFNGGGSL